APANEPPGSVTGTETAASPEAAAVGENGIPAGSAAPAAEPAETTDAGPQRAPHPVAAAGAFTPAAPELATVSAGWSEALSHLSGPARGILAASRPRALDGSSVVVEVSPALLSSSERYGDQLADALATALALRLEPRFVVVETGETDASPVPADGDGTISEVELVDQLRRRLDATEEAG
ncbi:MAG: hypothetical protein QOI71_3534, partial [Gaiellales bacterium]|nr:hypothetical protein [Gaiellales bacterium]